MQDYSKLYQYIDDHAEEYIALLQQFCRQPSISAQNMGLREMAQLIMQTLQNMHAQTDLVKTGGAPIVYAEWAGRNPSRTVTFYNHYDVQPVEPLDEWESDPFGAQIRNGKLYARGATDNKGSLLSRLCAVMA